MNRSITNTNLGNWMQQPIPAASLAFFRLVFGLMIFGGIVRFWAKGWIEELYIQPKFFFHYYGFEWVKPLGNNTYWLFLICGLSALFFALGWFYRTAATILFLSFTYIELMDKTNYLNHYYFVSLVLFLMIWLPAHVSLSVDAVRKPPMSRQYVPRWTTGSIRLMLGLVYFYAGLAKLNSDWLFQAMPLKLWLPAKNDMPLLGPLFNETWVAYLFSWFGAAYDLSIAFFLLYKPTRIYAYAAVIIFHVMTALLFPIGMFPYIMIVSTLIFFDGTSVEHVLSGIQGWFGRLPVIRNNLSYSYAAISRKTIAVLFGIFFLFQVCLPWRYLMTPGELFWTEEGYRFSWRVMLMEKMGYSQFIVKDSQSGKKLVVNNNDFLTRNQEKMMATQADFILQYAHHLHEYYKAQGMNDPEVNAIIYVTLNGRRSKLFADPNANLAKEYDSFKPKNWILNFEDSIYGL